MTTTAPKHPILQYHGGKWVLAKKILAYFPQHRTYVEPYGGGASILLRKSPCYSEVYNDLDDEVFNVFRVMQDPAMSEQLREKLAWTPFARKELEVAYSGSECDSVERARRTFVKSFMGRGINSIHRKSGFRANAQRSGTIPAHDWKNWIEMVSVFRARLMGVILECRPALEVISIFDSESTLFYCDPPYVMETRRPGVNYRFEMTDEQHEELADALHGIDGMAIISGYNCPLYEKLYSDWQRVDFAAYADGARDRVESIWLSPRVAEQQGRLF